MSLCEDPLHEM